MMSLSFNLLIYLLSGCIGCVTAGRSICLTAGYRQRIENLTFIASYRPFCEAVPEGYAKRPYKHIQPMLPDTI